MKRMVAFFLVLLMTLSAPASMARHFSVGVEDGVGLSPEESTSDPSVPHSAYERGTRLDCFDAQNLTAENVRAAARADGFCGDLVYHENRSLRHISSEDQDLNRPVGTFDVVTTHVVGVYGVVTCWPFCQGPIGDPVWQVSHEAGNELGLSDTPEEASRQENGDRLQKVAVNFHYPSASRAAQQSTSLWEMNGWLTPTTARSFVGFVLDENGDAISQSQLDKIVAEQRSEGTLHPDARAQVCGFVPDMSFVFPLPTGECDISFNYQAPGDGGANFQNGYRDECDSPSYVCSAVTGPAWYATAACFGTNADRNGRDSTCGGNPHTDYLPFHWFVAPHPSACGGAQQPGASFESNVPGEPYLAHDLDVYTPSSSIRASTQSRSIPALLDYGNRGVQRATQAPLEQIDQSRDELTRPLPGLPSTPSPVKDALDAAGDALNSTRLVQKNDRVEPNAEPVDGIEDTSQHLVTADSPLQRSLDGPCDLLSSQETQGTVDPWVDLVDAEVQNFFTPGLNLAYYGNGDDRQDDGNQPGPGLLSTPGKVGMFTDKDDDGHYDQAGRDKFDGEAIKAVGAYPMLWDMWVDEAGDIDRDGGCNSPAAEGTGTLPVLMEKAGYGPVTGLVQALYLGEPTVFADTFNGRAFPYEEGNNIYLLMSQAAKHYYEGDKTDANPMDERIDTVVESLRAFAKGQGAQAPIEVKVPGDRFGYSSDFLTQCPGNTGSFSPKLQFAHECQTGCPGDTIVTAYAFQLTQDTVGGGALPPFTPGTEPFPFGAGHHAWYDVDPLDNDPDRNRDESSRPPT